MVWARAAADPALDLTPAEAAVLVDALAPVLTKYVPAAATAAGPEIALLMALGVILGPRLARPKAADNDDSNAAEPRRDTAAAGAAQPSSWATVAAGGAAAAPAQ